MLKSEAREKYLHKRREISPKKLEEISEKICNQLFSNFQLESLKVSLFLPIERKKEINTYKIWSKATSFGASVGIPKTNMKTNEMKQVLFESEDQLELSPYGIPEPKRGRTVAAEHFDIIFVPLLAVDKKGNRIGYGGGFYDRYLAKCSPRCKFIGLSLFDDLEDEIIDMEHTDIKLNYCITPNNIYRFE